MKNNQIVNLQNKKNLRQRMNRLHLSVNAELPFGVAVLHRGSLRKGAGEIKPKQDGSYDLDVDFIVKSDLEPKTIIKLFEDSIVKNLRDHEKLSRKSRVFTIEVNESGFKYNFDIAIKNHSNQILILENGKYLWK